MLIYNVTTKVDWSIAEAWLNWMNEIHIKEVMSSGCFEKHQLVRLLDVDEQEGPTYAVQYYATSKISYNNYIDNFAPAFRKHAIDKWGDKCISFRSLMEVL